MVAQWVVQKDELLGVLLVAMKVDGQVVSKVLYDIDNGVIFKYQGAKVMYLNLITYVTLNLRDDGCELGF